jgi:hypothetical protein
LTATRAALQNRTVPILSRIDKDVTIGEITPQMLDFLVEHLEEEHDEDQDYYVDKETLELLADNGADAELVAMLEKALGDDESMDIAWE